MSPRPRARWWRLIDWRVVAAAGVPVWAAVIGLVAWDKARPHPAKPAPVALIPHIGAPGPAEVAPPPKEQPAAPPVVLIPVVITQPAPPVSEPFWLHDEPVAAQEPPDAGPVAQQQAEEPADGCKTFGTAIRFVKSATEAMKRAKEEDKLVYVLHLSGNLEDEGFT